MSEPYVPKVDDYVIWERHGQRDEGWVYFVGDAPIKKKGFPTCPQYITIETGVKPKPYCEHAKNDRHKMIHTLLLCYQTDWKDLKYIKTRIKQDTQLELDLDL